MSIRQDITEAMEKQRAEIAVSMGELPPDYIGYNREPHAHLNACGTGELTVFIDPSKVKTLTLLGDEVRHYDLIEKPTSDVRCAFCGSTREEVAYMVQSPIGPCICDSCAVTVIHLMIARKGNDDGDA